MQDWERLCFGKVCDQVGSKWPRLRQTAVWSDQMRLGFAETLAAKSL